MDFRQYDNALGRFLNPDRLAELAPSITPYRFAFNNPNYWADPTGLFETQAAALAYINKYDLIGANVTKRWGHWVIESGEFIIYQSGNNIRAQFLNGETLTNLVIDTAGGGGGGSSGFGFGGNGGFDGVGVSTAGFGGNDYLQTLGLMYSTVGAYGERAFKSGSYTQTNGNKGNFHDRPFKRLSQNAKANYNYASNLSKLSKAGSIVAGGAIIYDVFDDGNIKSSTVVNTALLVTSLVFPPSAIFILGYGVADYFFDFSGKIDNRFGEIKTGIYED